MQRFRKDENPGRKERPSLGCRAGYSLMDESRVLEGGTDGVQQPVTAGFSGRTLVRVRAVCGLLGWC